ncbi:serine/arginine repetitive matrix protein 1-like isoform X3 [Entelurus aequoreus]|nr:serine/arginine repetitive matrix protein 1-like isoform X3 [Entelurus aequoreus]
MFVQPRQERHIIELWQKLTDVDKAPLSLPPRHAPKLNKGRFKVSRQHHLEGVASVKRLYIGRGAEVAHSPDTSRLMEAVFIQLSSHHSQEHIISGFRQSRWSLIMRDYTRIRENLSSNQAIKAAGCSIRLLEVNHRTLTLWFNKRCKDMAKADVVATVPAQSGAATTTQSLPAARELMEDIAQPHDAHDYQHPADTSGLACTRRGPVVPELYRAVVAAAAAAPPSSSSSAAAPPSSSSSAAAALPPPPPPPPPSSSAAAAPPPLGSTTRVPRSTAWYRKKKALSLGGIMDINDLKRTETFKCKLCGQPKNKEHGHSRYRNETFCARSQGRSVEEWLAEKRSQDTQRQRQTQHTRATQPLANPQTPVPNPQTPVPNPQTPVPNPQTPVPNPQTPVPNPQTPVPNPYAHSVLLRKILPKPPP